MDNVVELQRTDKWFADRCGKFTGSRFVDVLARKRNGEPLDAYSRCIWHVVTERISGKPVMGPSGAALRWGVDVEPYARDAYELRTGLIVEQSEFITHPKYAFTGCSPDGLIGIDGGIEMKCPKDEIIHLQRFVEGVPAEYRPQCHGFLWVTGRKWIDFVSYDPRQSERFQLLRIRVNRDDAFIAELETAVLAAEEDAQKLQTKLERIAA